MVFKELRTTIGDALEQKHVGIATTKNHNAHTNDWTPSIAKTIYVSYV
jgi:hypothetical protein